MKKCSRILLLLLALALVLPFAAGCNENGTVSDNSSETETSDTSGTVSEDVPPELAFEASVTVKTKGGMKVEGVTVSFTDVSGNICASGETDENGCYTGILAEGSYKASVSELKAGYTSEGDAEITGTPGEKVSAEILLSTAVITDATSVSDDTYQTGDVMYDFSFPKNGRNVKLSEILESKKLVVINFWATWCGPCRSEFPAMQRAYESFEDSVEIIAISTDDSAVACEEFKQEGGYTFNMVAMTGDLATVYQKFMAYGNGGIPFTLFIDRYGVFVNHIFGADPNVDAWEAEFTGYTSDNYVQNPGTSASEDPDRDTEIYDLPDISMQPSSEIEAVANGEGFHATYLPPNNEEKFWPFRVSDDGTCIIPGNVGRTPADRGKSISVAQITAEIDLSVGQVFVFDWKANLETDPTTVYNYDVLRLYVNGFLMEEISGKTDGWETKYVYTPAYDGHFNITFEYEKDATETYYDLDGEYCMINNLRVISMEETLRKIKSFEVRQSAANVVNPDPSETSYLHYSDVVYNENDGFYHVGEANGPLLLCDLMGQSAWAPSSLNDLGYGGFLKIGPVNYYEMVSEYAWMQQNGIRHYTAVDRKLATLLNLIVSNIGEGANHDKEWLELCCYIDHYGEGEGVTKIFDIRRGISVDSAIPAYTDRLNHAEFNQVLVPRGQFFEFIPTVSGVYKFYSVDGEEAVDTDGWFILPDGSLRGKIVDESDDDGEGANFCLYYNCVAGEKYYIAVGFHDPSTIGGFDFRIDYLGETYDRFIDCTRHYTSDLQGNIFVDRMYDLHAALGEDGYYHQILGYNDDGTPILDLSEHGYLYVNFCDLSIFMGFLSYNGYTFTLEDYITLADQNREFGFDFTQKVDAGGNSMEDYGNHQAVMEDYLAIAKATTGTEHGFVKADERLINILESTLVALYGEYDASNQLLPDQWMMFCCYYRHV